MSNTSASENPFDPEHGQLRLFELIGQYLDIAHHDVPERHDIGAGLPQPSAVTALQGWAAGFVGQAPQVARADHKHAIDGGICIVPVLPPFDSAINKPVLQGGQFNTFVGNSGTPGWVRITYPYTFPTGLISCVVAPITVPGVLATIGAYGGNNTTFFDFFPVDLATGLGFAPGNPAINGYFMALGW